MQTLYIEHASMMFRLALKYTKNSTDADDIVSSVCEALIHRLSTIRALPPRLQAAYIHSAVRRHSLLLLRKKSNESTALQKIQNQAIVEEADVADPADVIAIARCTLQEVVQAIRQLPETDRSVLELRYFDRLSEADIANMLGLAHSTVRSRIRRARLRLQAILEVNQNAP